MKKTISSILVMITVGASFCIAQSSPLVSSNLEDFYVENKDLKSNTKEVKTYSEVSTSKIYDIPKSAVTFQLSENFKLLNIEINNNVIYTKAELLNKKDNTTVQSLQINESSTSVNISKISAGTYYMILSNKEGDVFSEKIIIL